MHSLRFPYLKLESAEIPKDCFLLCPCTSPGVGDGRFLRPLLHGIVKWVPPELLNARIGELSEVDT